MKEEMTSKLIDYLEGRLSEEERIGLEAELAISAELSAELSSLEVALKAYDGQEDVLPSANLSSRFYDFLEREEAQTLKQSPGRIISLFRLQKVEWGIAGAVAILLIGIAFGHLWQHNLQQQAQIDILQHEVATTRKLMLLSMLQEPSASQRIKALNVSVEKPVADPQITEALIHTLLHDNSGNVRMKAATALVHFSEENGVKEALIEALSKEERPEVQITIIDVLVKIQAPSAIKTFEELLKKEDVLDVVKTKAASGMEKLI